MGVMYFNRCYLYVMYLLFVDFKFFNFLKVYEMIWIKMILYISFVYEIVLLI